VAVEVEEEEHELCGECGCEECGNSFDCLESSGYQRDWCHACRAEHANSPCPDWRDDFDLWCYSCRDNHYDYCGGCGCETCGTECGDCHNCGGRYGDITDPSEEHTKGCVDTAAFLKLPRSVGLEVELDNGPDELPSIPVKFGAKEDGSLHGYFPSGCEFVTNPGYGHEFEQDVDQLYHNAIGAGYKAEPQAGLHVHVDASDLDDARCYYLMALWFSCQRTLYGLYPSRRSGYGGMWSLGDHGGSRQAATRKMLDLAEEGQPFPRWDFNSHNNGLCGRTGYNTFEFRMFGSTEDSRLALAWASLCEHMVDYASNGVKRKSIEGLARTPNSKEKLNALMNLVKLPAAAKRRLNARWDECNSGRASSS
jgi:hypothetical protein